MDDIQLPPLPHGSETPASSQWQWSDGDMRQYAREAVLADRDGRQQPIYGYHIVSEVNGNGVAFCPADHAEEITAFLMAFPGTTIVPVIRAPADAQRGEGE